MEEKLQKLLNLTSIPAILVVFYLELKTIDVHIEQIDKLRDTIAELEETIHDCRIRAHFPGALHGPSNHQEPLTTRSHNNL